jgi:hypothetical protein
MANQIVRAIEQMIIKIMIVEPLMRSLQSAYSGGSICRASASTRSRRNRQRARKRLRRR